ncbi:MAG: GNAT family N-acetyltransferase [Bryobacteraceae bacterium]|nr:GNAT family N-acetyltransferase [Bryobacteraceae bacterium]
MEIEDELDDFGPFEELQYFMTEVAEMDDLPYLLEIDEEAQQDPDKRRMIEAAIQDRTCKLVAHGEQVLAYGIFDYSAKGKMGHARLVFVAPSHRRQGVGSELLMTFESICEQPRIYARVPVTNLAAQEMLKRVGYQLEKNLPTETIFVKHIWEPTPFARPETVQ